MAEKYDGWALKIGDDLLIDYAFKSRLEVIKKFEVIYQQSWGEWERKGEYEIIKIKLVEVDND